jgi:transcriptional regulator GlxA family with amidase domain
MHTVGILIFEGVELLDFTGPYQVFSACGEWDDNYLYQVFTASPDGNSVKTHNGLRVIADTSFADMPSPDVLVVPGGDGVYPLKDDATVHRLIQQQREKGQLLSVCTGSLLLAKAGVLHNLPATTYHTRLERLVEYDPTITPKHGERFVDNGNIITAAGVSAGIDASLYYIAREHGMTLAQQTAEYIEYEHWKP